MTTNGSNANSKTAVLLLAHGSPDRVEEIPEFLRYVTGGRPVPDAVVAEVQHRYGLIGHSPLTEITLRQAQALSEQIQLPVYVGMRNWNPFIADTVRQMAADGIERAVTICLAPQNSRTSVGLYRSALQGQLDTMPFECDFVESWHDHPLLIRAFAEKLKAGWTRGCEEAGEGLPVIFTAHSVPQRTIAEGDPYQQQAHDTAALVAMESGFLRMEDWTFAFQSQGMSGGPWLGPSVEDTIADLQGRGHKGIFVQPIGFVCDHVEVLYDIDIGFRKFAADRDMKLWRAESLNDSPLFIAALVDVARSRLATGAPPQKIVQIKV
ncbi:MAG TPA: ferrochelatase [Terriglobales bacterium]|nr:ferrochelatase [Terriglobales bacterium]